LILIFASSVSAARVGIVVEYPNKTIVTECVLVRDGSDGYEVLEASHFPLTWSDSGQWGHALCAIGDIGCPSDNCFCSTQYWGFYLARGGAKRWSYMPVGFDGGEVCWNGDLSSYVGHYCAQDGDVIGFGYGGFGNNKPEFVSFSEIEPKCPKPRKTKRKIKVELKPSIIFSQSTFKIKILDETNNKPLSGAEVKIYEGMPGTSKSLYKGKTGKNGEVVVPPLNAGKYKVQVVRKRYPHKIFTLSVQPLIRKPSEYTTTTTQPTTTTTTQPTITTTTQPTITTTTQPTTTTTHKRPLPPSTIKHSPTPSPSPKPQQDQTPKRRIFGGKVTGHVVKHTSPSPVPSSSSKLSIILLILGFGVLLSLYLRYL